MGGVQRQRRQAVGLGAQFCGQPFIEAAFEGAPERAIQVGLGVPIAGLDGRWVGDNEFHAALQRQVGRPEPVHRPGAAGFDAVIPSPTEFGIARPANGHVLVASYMKSGRPPAARKLRFRRRRTRH